MGLDSTRAGFPTAVWLAALVVAVLCVGASLGLLAFPRWRRRSIPVLMRLAMLVLIVLLGTELLGDADLAIDHAWQPWSRLLAVGAFVAAGALFVGAASWRGYAVWWQRWGRSALLLVVSLALSLAARWRIEKPLHEDANWMSDYESSLLGVSRMPIESDGKFAVTDKGRRIPLEHFVTDEVSITPESAESRVPDSYRARVIIDEATASPANCHGWVFTAGRYLVRSRYVDAILHDNGYHVVSEPQLGDLIIYRDDAGDPIHTGIVKAIGDAGFVLIESKWGMLDTYLHLPQDQVYSQGYAYYRSSRAGHQLKKLAGGGPT